MDGPYEDELGRRVRDVAEDVEEVEFHGAARCMQRLHSASDGRGDVRSGVWPAACRVPRAACACLDAELSWPRGRSNSILCLGSRALAQAQA